MSRSKAMTREQVLEAIKTQPARGYFVWDGEDESERPATAEEMAAGVETQRRRRGRPLGSGTREQVAIRLDVDALDAFRASGPGWQTRMNAALREWLKEHPAA